MLFLTSSIGRDCAVAALRLYLDSATSSAISAPPQGECNSLAGDSPVGVRAVNDIARVFCTPPGSPCLGSCMDARWSKSKSERMKDCEEVPCRRGNGKRGASCSDRRRPKPKKCRKLMKCMEWKWAKKESKKAGCKVRRCKLGRRMFGGKCK